MELADLGWNHLQQVALQVDVRQELALADAAGQVFDLVAGCQELC